MTNSCDYTVSWSIQKEGPKMSEIFERTQESQPSMWNNSCIFDKFKLLQDESRMKKIG